jgi:hypothetical protein
MLDPQHPNYLSRFRAAVNYARCRIPQGYIPLPVVILNLPCSRWVDPVVWRRGNADEIVDSVFMLVGNRPPVVTPTTYDDNIPVRGLFITTVATRTYESFHWPGGVPPLVFYSIISKQRASHCHVAMVFSYYGKSVNDWCDALGIPRGSCGRIKLNWEKVCKYMRLQARTFISYVVNDRRGLFFEDYHRISSRRSAVLQEIRSLGYPYMLDNRTPRRGVWTRPRFVNPTELLHVEDFEVYTSKIIGGVGNDYHGESVVVVTGKRDGTVDIPVTCLFVVIV